MSGSIVVFGLDGGHLQRFLPLVALLARRGRVVHVLAKAAGRAPALAAGGRFVDLFERYPWNAVDPTSRPVPSRLVTHAAAYAEAIAAEVAALAPSLIVYDSFVVVAPLVARRLGVPYVSMRSGHAQVPARAVAETRADPRVAISDACRLAIETLRAGELPDANPFSYLEGLSPHLNLIPEPEPFLPVEDRAAFAPYAYWGCLAPEQREAAARTHPFAAATRRPRIHVAFGTVIWGYFAPAARAALVTLAQALPEAELLVGLGHHELDDATRAALACARVETYVDQWAALRDADLFVTHHGLSSTHEAVYHQVPMLSVPFLGDQPAMARRCAALGLAEPLTDAPRAPLEVARVRAAVDDVVTRRDAFLDRLAIARGWEDQVHAGREAVVDQLLSL